MRSFSRHSRLLPLTMTVIALLFTEKAVGLAREATMPPTQPIAHAAPDTRTAAPAAPASQIGSTAAPSLLSSTTPAVSQAELQTLQDLRRRRQLLDEREHRLDERNDLLQSAELKLQTRLDELTALQKRLEQVEDARHKRDSANWSGLVKTYEDMKARDAAAIFDVLDLSVMLEVLDRMDERKAAAILAGMLPERARLATQMLAQKRIRQDIIPAAGSTSALSPEDRHS